MDCTKVDMDALNRCWAKNESKGEASALIACLPFSDRIMTEGFWVVGFEKNDFFERKRPPPEDILWSQSTGAELVVDRRLLKPSGATTRIFEVAVVGRRALCPVGGLNEYPIAVEKLQIRRRIG